MNRVHRLLMVGVMVLLPACTSLRNVEHTMQWGEAAAAQAHELAQAMREQPAPRDTVVFSDVSITCFARHTQSNRLSRIVFSITWINLKY
jgi:hypothetical protein